MKLTTVLVATSVLTLAACTAGSGDDPATRDDAPASGQSTQDAAPVTVSPHGEGVSCFKERARADRDWAWTAAQVRVLDDDLTGVTLGVEGEGVEVRQAYVARPTNFGGRIDHSGLAAWADRQELISIRQYSPAADLEADDFWAPTEGENVQVMMRLRFDDAVLAGDTVARVTAVTAEWQGEDADDTGTVRAATNERWAVAADCDAVVEAE
ncbi:hypothetical protein IEQ44_14615 [Nocardioides sp. Y6]|uniref:Secreted protein n=1 Tax=Nocardioides malaquae TaxID=2773426 RepID=A0ABR9RWY4_9ACTN|nr:hypothetical protein [Nocardioides malaquae]MBE7325880.1 hypothetical protein [Nocardioides malaquae]